MSAKKGSKTGRWWGIWSFLNLGCFWTLALALASFREGLDCLAASLTVSGHQFLPEHQFHYTQSRHLFLFNDLVSQKWELGHKPRGSSWGGVHSNSPTATPGAMGVPLELGPLIKEVRQKFWPKECSGKAQLCAGVLSPMLCRTE